MDDKKAMDINKISIGLGVTVKEALKKLDRGGQRTLFVVDGRKKLLGLVTDSDIRRHMLRNGLLTDSLKKCYNSKPTVMGMDYDIAQVKEIMLSHKWELIPIVDSKGRLEDFLSWERVFDDSVTKRADKIGIPVVIMAGGKGTRLAPFTHILPKPLIPIGERPVIEVIMDRFNDFGVDNFFLTINYKGDMIKSYFENSACPYKINYIREKKFLGTAGSLRLLPKRAGQTFFVSNCDVIVETDYADVLEYHRENGNAITLVGSIQHYRIPYGVLNYGKGGKLKTIKEKPEFDMTVNTGLYVIERSALEHIPKAKQFDMNELINVLLKEKESVGVYPVSEKSYVDIGQWEEYKKSMDKLVF